MSSSPIQAAPILAMISPGPEVGGQDLAQRLGVDREPRVVAGGGLGDRELVGARRRTGIPPPGPAFPAAGRAAQARQVPAGRRSGRR